MEIVFTPESAKGDDASFEGTVTITAPTFTQRYKYIEMSNFEVGEKGEVTASGSNIGAMRKMVELAATHVKKVDLKYKPDNTKYKSYDDLISDPVCDQILMEIAGALMKGMRPSKN